MLESQLMKGEGKGGDTNECLSCQIVGQLDNIKRTPSKQLKGALGKDQAQNPWQDSWGG